MHDLNVEYFSKQTDFSSISKNDSRYNDRPTLSLKEISISTDQSSGPIYFTDVTLEFKIHKKNNITDQTLLALLFPGAPLELEYGWNSPADVGDGFINEAKERLLMNVKNYNITMDSSGQMDLTVECMAYNNILGETLVGDDGKEIDIPNTTQKHQGSTLHANFKRLEKYIKYANMTLQHGKSRNERL